MLPISSSGNWAVLWAGSPIDMDLPRDCLTGEVCYIAFMCVMDAQRSSRLNRLLLSLPEGFLADSAWLQAQGLSRSSIRDYVDRGWLERIAPRVYRRPSQHTKASLRWDVAVLSLQQIMNKPI